MQIQNDAMLTAVFGARTKIIATLGPKSWDEPTIERMVNAGASAFRLNFSHRDKNYDVFVRAIEAVRNVARRAGKPLAIVQDLQGPKIRTASLCGDAPVPLAVGEIVRLTHTEPCSRPGVIATNYKELVHDVGIGDRILIDDGSIELQCTDRQPDVLICEVKAGGFLYSRKGINLPGVDLSTSGFTEQDERDLRFGIEQNIDFVALSFVRKAADIIQVRDFVRREFGKDKKIAIIAKIEKPEALKNLTAILNESEGIMVARGDLGVEIPCWNLPIVQKDIIAAARARGRVVITATQMLESMTQNPRPTRAESTDVANAILDGTDGGIL